MKFGYSSEEQKILISLKTPKKIQDFLETLEINFEKDGDTCYSPRKVLRLKKAHCMEGAMLAAALLEFHGYPPLILDLRSTARDFDHVVAVFKQYGCWGAISKTNHAVLRYREPVYKTIRELVLSYFHEYFDDSGRKTLRDYSKPFNLQTFDHSFRLSSTSHKEINWRISEKDLFEIPEYLDSIKHYKILSSAQTRNLRKADALEIAAGKLV